MDKGKGNGSSSGHGKGVHEEIDGFFNESTSSSALNRNEMMELTAKELAKMAQPYSTLKLNSLERKSKSFLCDLILNKSDKKQDDEDKPHARAGRTQSESEQFINTALMMLSAMKQSRDGEPINAMASEVFKKQAVAYVDEKVSSDDIDLNKASSAFLVLSAGAILFDGLVGFKNAPALFHKIKSKFTKKKDDSK